MYLLTQSIQEEDRVKTAIRFNTLEEAATEALRRIHVQAETNSEMYPGDVEIWDGEIGAPLSEADTQRWMELI